MKIAIFDYGAGNLHSLAKALARSGHEIVVDTDPRRAIEADMLVLPGVGAFGAAAGKLAPARDEVRRALADGLPAIGVCLGMQLLFDESEEGVGAGIGLIPGRVTKLRAPRVPHIGWNSMEAVASAEPALARTPLDTAYFAHSYVCRPMNPDVVTAWTSEGGDRFPAAVRVGRTVGVQFHPEKSSAAGVELLEALVDEAFR
jgi:imidazole glycerol-phosphate synthase subunit HisH